MPKSKLKNDQYKRTRGGYSRLFEVTCTLCTNKICDYQKDGPGILKRMYFDRITGLDLDSYTITDIKQIPPLKCSKCNELLATPMIYTKENRLAYRLFVGSTTKKIIKNV